MKSVVEPLEGNKVKLSVEVDASEFEHAVDAAFKKIAREVRVPGFRPGRAPRRILEARFGREAGRAEAIRDAVPEYYAQAVREHEVDAIAPPEIDITAGEASGDVAFDAVVEVRPHLSLSGYDRLRVEVTSPLVEESDIDGHIDRLRGGFASLAVADRPAADGDHLTIDLRGTREGADVPGMTLDDTVYELGTGGLFPEVDEHLVGAKAGDTVEFSAESVNCLITVQVKEVKEKVLPEATDEWAAENSEFTTLADLRADVAKRVASVKKEQATMALRNGTVEALVELVEDEVPEPLVASEVERQVHDLGHRLEAQGATIGQWLAATGRTEEDILGELRTAAIPAVKADLALRAVAETEKIEPTEDDLTEELARIGASYQLPAEEVRAQLERADQLSAVRSDLRKSKALEWLIERVEVVDTEGNPVDRAALELDDIEGPAGSAAPEAEAAEVPEAPPSGADPVETGDA